MRPVKGTCAEGWFAQNVTPPTGRAIIHGINLSASALTGFIYLETKHKLVLTYNL